MKSINLGNSPTSMAEQIQSAPKQNEVYYPTFHFTVKGEEVEIPDAGTMTVTFRRKEKTERECCGQEEYSFCLEIQSIDRVTEKEEPAAPARNLGKETENALRKLKAAKEYPEGEAEEEEEE